MEIRGTKTKLKQCGNTHTSIISMMTMITIFIFAEFQDNLCALDGKNVNNLLNGHLDELQCKMENTKAATVVIGISPSFLKHKRNYLLV